MRPGSIIAATVAVALTTVAAPTGAALAAPVPTGVQYVNQNIFPSIPPTDNDPARSVRADVACPSGYQVTGSGAGPNPDSIMPVGDFTKATVQGAVIFGGFPSVVGELVCAPSSQFSDVITRVVRDHTVKPDTWHRTTAKCPTGYYAFGGGGNLSSLAPSGVQENGPTLDGQSWAFTGYAPRGVQTSMNVTTRCAPRTGRNFLKAFTSSVATANPLQEVRGYAECPAGYQAISGGFQVTNADGTPFIPGLQSAIAIWTIPVPADPTRNSSWFADVWVTPGTYLSVVAQCVI